MKAERFYTSSSWDHEGKEAARELALVCGYRWVPSGAWPGWSSAASVDVGDRGQEARAWDPWEASEL